MTTPGPIDRDQTISVIVITHGRARRLRRCLESIYDQRGCPPLEVIVVDDGTDHETRRACVEFSHQRDNFRSLHGPHRGPAAARNAGILLARGEHIAFIDDDCIADPLWLLELRQCLRSSGADVATGRTTALDSSTRWARAFDELSACWIAHTTFCSGLRARLAYRRKILERGGEVHYAPTNNIAFRREVFAAVGLFEERMGHHAAEDLELNWRLVQSGRRICFTPRARVQHLHRADRRAFLRQMAWWGEGLARVKQLHPEFYLGVSRWPWEYGLNYAMPVGVALLIPLLLRFSDYQYLDIFFLQELQRRWSFDRAFHSLVKHDHAGEP